MLLSKSFRDSPLKQHKEYNKMKLKLLVSILASAIAIQAVSAISLVDFEPNKNGSPGQLTFDGFSNGSVSGLSVLGGQATLSYNANVVVQSNNDAEGAPPFEHDGTDYLSVKTNGVATLMFNAATSQLFGFQWGSIDTYNTIEFFLSGVSQGSFTGADVVASPVAANGFQGSNGSAYVTFGGGKYDKVVFTSSQNSFEIDNVSLVPDTGTTLALFGLGLSGLAILSRRKFTAR